MTVAYNLSQLANRVNTSGQLDASTGLINPLPAISGANLTNLNASQLTSGTVANARLPVGTVIQTVYGQASTRTQTTSSSFIDATDVTLTITPTSASSKILVNFSVNALVDAYDILGLSCVMQIVRNGTAIGGAQSNAFGAVVQTNIPIILMDLPNTTSACVYKLQFRRVVNYGSTGNSVSINNDPASIPSATMMLLQEIKA